MRTKENNKTLKGLKSIGTLIGRLTSENHTSVLSTTDQVQISSCILFSPPSHKSLGAWHGYACCNVFNTVISNLTAITTLQLSKLATVRFQPYACCLGCTGSSKGVKGLQTTSSSWVSQESVWADDKMLVRPTAKFNPHNLLAAHTIYIATYQDCSNWITIIIICLGAHVQWRHTVVCWCFCLSFCLLPG